MSPPQQIGVFVLSSNKIVVADPGYDEQTARVPGLGCFVSPCEPGEWAVELVTDRTAQRKWEMPRFVTATRVGFHLPEGEVDWKRIGKVGGDAGILGIYDFAHFHDDKIIPKDQQWTFDGAPAIAEMLWYSFNCERIQGKLIAIIPHGMVVRWDGGMHVDIFEMRETVVAIRMSISGWPDHV